MIYKKKITIQELKRELGAVLKKIEQLKLPKGFLESALYIVAELAANIEEHSRAKNILATVSINRQQCLIKIADDGIGLKKSYLLKKIYPKDDFAAVEFALSGLSTKSSQERGFGLYSIRKLIEALRGRMTIKSGLAKAIIEKSEITFENNPTRIQGVEIDLKAPIKPINFYQVIG